MGRNKIKIERIESERKRTATYTKRSHGLIKKAMELSILCDCEVSLFIFANDKLVVYSSKDVKDTLIKFVEFKSNYFSYSNADYPAICHSTSIPEDLSEQRAVGANGMGDGMAKDVMAADKGNTSGNPQRPPVPQSQVAQGSILPPPQHVPIPADFYDNNDRRNSQYMYDQQRVVPPQGDLLPPDYHPGDPSFSYPPMYRGPGAYPPMGNYQQQQQVYKGDSKFKPVDAKRPDSVPDDGQGMGQIKKPPEA
ncbi:myocyte-specific enhancer factor 2B, putative [Entamoeba invadens IP1]|uniref:Myocyte-specific enhancer factor 2B, putative n=1 Tax=Entamoeba invadens IP1 TaxID=370355 RepID=A0A0A1TYP3_ENTIV|nr:myocyte-specific enhancer factor 2B, putative [Entamoeba invadens IP1]ELP84685.1 myocyte-specific enhancer factor 2B, putative [Entamoeba invadens IP1]|eukprot:XP_004184031.1 myocyte-specific enhancer factor 2B, putative [Entamoeba invadens IP1]